MVTGHIETPEVLELSRKVFEAEDEFPKGTDYSDFDAHPLVLDLLENCSHDAVKAALAYLAEGNETDVPGVIRWMIAGAYKGCFNDAEQFASDQFEAAISDHYDQWGQRDAIGFPNVTIGDLINWEGIGYSLAYEEPVVFHMVKIPSGGVHVFDVSIDIRRYTEGCQWIIGCGRFAVTLLNHPKRGAVPACQGCFIKEPS